MAGIKYRAIYKNTTIDPPGTIKHVRENGVEVMQPKESFFKLIERKGMPTRRARFCCEVLKEYKILDIAIQGIRRSESTARAERYSEDDPIICRVYGSKENCSQVVLPILSWTDKDVADFIEARGIRCHPLYYDNDGKFHPNRRLGCMGCPLRSDNGLSEYKERPKLLLQIIKHAKIWWDTHPNLKSHEKFGNIYGLVAHNIFYNSYEEWKKADNSMFGRMDWKRKLEEYFNIKL